LVASSLPADLVAYLRDGRELEYDPATCEAGKVSLRPLVSLVVELFPTDPQSRAISAEDPHRGQLGCYLVPAVNLTQSAEGYEATC
jgi:hypothetical protein